MAISFMSLIKQEDRLCLMLMLIQLLLIFVAALLQRINIKKGGSQEFFCSLASNVYVAVQIPELHLVSSATLINSSTLDIAKSMILQHEGNSDLEAEKYRQEKKRRRMRNTLTKVHPARVSF